MTVSTQNLLSNPQIPLMKDWGAARSAAFRNLYFFETAVCSEAWMDKFHDFGRINKLMCDFLQDRKYRRKFLSAFRLSFKTTVLVGFFAWLFCLYLVRNKPMSMIYNTYTKDNAHNFSADVRHTLLENDYLHWLVPELPKLEKNYDVMTKNRIQHKHVRLDFASLEQTMVSRHYPIFVNDDLENDKNIETKAGRESLKRSWKYQKAILTKIRKKGLGLEVDVGTPFHYEGLIWMLRNNVSYKKLIIPYKNKNGKLSFPELYTQEDFDEKFEDMGSYISSCQFLLKPISEKDAMVRPGWIEHYDVLPRYRWRTMVIDAGGAEPGEHDATGITIVDTDEKGNLYVVLAQEYWLTPNELMDKIAELRKIYDPDDTRIEKEQYTTTIADIFQHRYPLENISFVRHKRRDKPGRIWKLRQWYENGRVFHPRTGVTKLEEQLLRYQGEGSIELDDLIDSLAYHLDLPRHPYIPATPRSPHGAKLHIDETFDKEMDKYIMEKELGESNVTSADHLF